jgi:hypothetical protein
MEHKLGNFYMIERDNVLIGVKILIDPKSCDSEHDLFHLKTKLRTIEDESFAKDYSGKLRVAETKEN